MANENIDIRIREDGSRVVKRNIEDIGSSAEKSAEGVNILKKALGALSVGLLIRELIRMADAYTNIQNRLRTVTTSTAQLNVVNKELFAIANQTRTAYESTVEVFVRMAGASKALGLSQRELLDFQKSLNQAVALSGATATEANAALIQLAQGMGAGALRGEELNSVLEQLPTVADIIAKGMGVTRGQLKGLAQDGKITADVVISAFAKAREELENKFAKAVPTIGQGFVVLKNNVLATVGAFLNSSGAASGLANILIFLGENMDTIARFAGAAAITIGTVLAAQAIPKAISAINALTVAIAANPLGALAVAITATIALLIAFSDKIQLGGGSLATLQDLAVAVWGKITQATEAFVDWFNKNFGQVAEWAKKTFGDVDVSVSGVLKVAATVADGIVGFFLGAYRAIVAAFTNFPAAMDDIFKRAMNGVASIVETTLNGIIKSINAVTSFAGLGTIDEVQIKRAELSGVSLGKSVGDAFNSGLEFSGAKDAVNGLLDDANKVAVDRLRREEAKAQAEAAAQAGLADKGVRTLTTPVDKKALRELEKLKNELIGLLSNIDPVRSGLLQLAKDQDTLEKAFAKGLITTDEYTRYLKALKTQSTEDILGPVLDKVDPVRVAMTGLANDTDLLRRAREKGLITAQQEIDYLGRLQVAYKESTQPLKFMTDELTKQIEIAGKDSRAREIATELRQRVLDLQKQGVTLTQAETDALQKQLETLQRVNEQQAIRDGLLSGSVEKRKQFSDTVGQAQGLVNDPASGFTKSDAFSAVSEASGRPDLFANSQEAIDAKLEQTRNMYAQIDQMRQADLISDRTANMARAQLDVEMTEMRLSNARTMFGQLAQLSRSKNKELAAIGRAAAATQATIDGVLAVQKALASYPPPYNFAMAAIVGAVAASNVASILTSNSNFATGGSFTVPGSGGVDSQMIALRATPGERFTVQTPTQQRHGTAAANEGQGAGGGGSPQLNQRIINVLDPAMVGDFLATPEGEQVLINVMRRNADTINSAGGN